MLKLMGKKIFTVLCLKICLSKPMINTGLAGDQEFIYIYLHSQSKP